MLKSVPAHNKGAIRGRSAATSDTIVRVVTKDIGGAVSRKDKFIRANERDDMKDTGGDRGRGDESNRATNSSHAAEQPRDLCALFRKLDENENKIRKFENSIFIGFFQNSAFSEGTT